MLALNILKSFHFCFLRINIKEMLKGELGRDLRGRLELFKIENGLNLKNHLTRLAFNKLKYTHGRLKILRMNIVANHKIVDDAIDHMDEIFKIVSSRSSRRGGG